MSESKFPPRVFVTQNVYTSPPAPEANYEQADHCHDQREEYLSLEEHTAAMEQKDLRIKDLEKQVSGRGLEIERLNRLKKRAIFLSASASAFLESNDECRGDDDCDHCVLVTAIEYLEKLT